MKTTTNFLLVNYVSHKRIQTREKLTLYLLRVVLLALTVFQVDYACLASVSNTPQASNSKTPPTPQFDFEIVAIWPPGDIDPITIAFGSITNSIFTKDDLSKLLDQLRKRFIKEPKVRVLLLDNKRDAILYGKKLMDDFGVLNDKLRITYFRDSSKCIEYIEYSPDKKKSKKKIRLDYKCEALKKK